MRTEALALTDETLSPLRVKLGENHPLTLSCAINLASCHSDSGDQVTAEALERRTIEQLAEVLGPDHPDTMICLANLSLTMRQAGQIAEAEDLWASASAAWTGSSARHTQTSPGCAPGSGSTGS